MAAADCAASATVRRARRAPGRTAARRLGTASASATRRTAPSQQVRSHLPRGNPLPLGVHARQAVPGLPQTRRVRTYQELFAVAEFRAIFIAQCLANAAAAAGSLALGTVTYAATGNAVLTGLSMFGGPLIRLAASWFTSSAADLVRPRQALMAVAAVTGAADLLQAVPGMPWGARFALLALPWIALAATGGAMLALVSDILPADSYVFGRATLNIAVGGMQVAGYGLGGLLLVALTTSGLFLAAAGAAAVAVVVVYRASATTRRA